MKKLVFLFTLLLVIGASSVFAQRGQGGGGQRPESAGQGQRGQRPEGVGGQNQRGQRPEGATNQQGEGQRNGQFGKRELKDIGLTDEQKAQIKQIRKDAKANNTDRETVRSQIEGVLTSEQLEKIKQRRSQQQQP